MDTLSLARDVYPHAVALRRHFHEMPECGPTEQWETMACIEQELDRMHIRHVRVPGGGIFGFIDGSAGGKTILLRADMDGLPVQEDSCNLKGPKRCVSKRPGVMHGCGHDAHTAMLLAEAGILQAHRSELPGSVILMFEQGEEGVFNVEPMCRYLQQQALSIDGCYATHVRWDIPAGKIACCEDVAMSGLQWFHLKLHGTGGHGSRPDLAHSPVDCFCQIYSALQALRLNRIRPDTELTWSIGALHAGNSDNVIPDELSCGGTIRMFDRESGAAFWQGFRDITAHTAALCGCTAELIRSLYLLPVRNDTACRTLFCRSAATHLGADALYPADAWMASESFSYLSSMYPSVLSFVGIRNDALGSGANHHTPQFDLDESCMVPGIAAAVGYVFDFLADPPDTTAFRPVCANMEALAALLHRE